MASIFSFKIQLAEVSKQTQVQSSAKYFLLEVSGMVERNGSTSTKEKTKFWHVLQGISKWKKTRIIP